MGQREALVKAALGQKGTTNGRKYVQWYNEVSGRYIALTSAWCAIFVSWCARQAGISEEQLPTFAGCTSGRNTFRRLGVWFDRDDHTPQRGDLILFDWDGDPTMSEHVGIVTHADNKYVYTIEGNAGTPGTVKERQYGRKSGNVLGYVAWREKEEEVDMTKAEVQQMIDAAVAKTVRELTPKTYHTMEELPKWAREPVGRLREAGVITGDGENEISVIAGGAPNLGAVALADKLLALGATDRADG